MELANCLLALGGDRNNTVPKYSVTPAEIAVMSAIHGADAVFDIEPLGEEVKRSARDEVERLVGLYTARDEENRLVVGKVYPGVSPVMHMTLADLGLPEELYKATERQKPKEAPKRPKAPAPKPEPIVQQVSNDADGLFDEVD
jgi:hypothetical protein